MTGFAQGAARLAGVAGWLLGWRPDEFWRATPAELAVVLRAARGDAVVDAGVDGAVLDRLRAMFPD
ncbi:phage tail assembly chaperone [Sphingobium sp.]|uniref:phage tail assembly chaperone n=1 Tax=Sphingobium sp. TaxID=1912891 RepID=UPI0025CC8DC4|nr:phage tail assembly chaperone [Sphingobium sp.]